MTGTGGYIPRDTLPESYGEGERQYDMATAAMLAIEQTAPALAVLAGTLFYVKWGWIAALAAAAAAWWLVHLPYKKALAVASTKWDAERAAYDEYLKSDQDVSGW